MRTAVILNTINRFHHTKVALDVTLNNAGADFDLFWWDNGSSNDRIKDLIKGFNPVWSCEAAKNVGNPPAYNVMLRLVKEQEYDYVVVIGSDLMLPNNWLALYKQVHELSGNKGLLGYDWGLLQDDKSVASFNGFELFKCPFVFGTWFFSSELLDTVGYFNEAYKMYGKWDSDFNYRITKSGIDSYYLPVRCLHLVDSNERTSEYRAFKDRNLKANEEVYKKQIELYELNNNYYIA